MSETDLYRHRISPLPKKVDLCGQKGSMQWKDAHDFLVKQKQLGELP